MTIVFIKQGVDKIPQGVIIDYFSETVEEFNDWGGRGYDNFVPG